MSKIVCLIIDIIHILVQVATNWDEKSATGKAIPGASLTTDSYSEMLEEQNCYKRAWTTAGNVHFICHKNRIYLLLISCGRSAI